jgi:hypothetical protein
MTSTNGEAGQRGSAEAGLDVFCLAAEDNRVNATASPAPQVAICDQHCSVVALVRDPATARSFLRQEARHET